MEAFNSRFKVEGLSLFLNAQTRADLVAVVDQRMVYYTERRHSSMSEDHNKHSSCWYNFWGKAPKKMRLSGCSIQGVICS
jgi:hypothetical protein